MGWYIAIGVIVLSFIVGIADDYIENHKTARNKKAYLDSLGTAVVEHKLGDRFSYFTFDTDKRVSVCLTNAKEAITRNESPFSITKFIELSRKNGFVAFDDTNRKVMFACDENIFFHEKLEYLVAKYEDIISVQVLEDGDTIFQKSAMRTIGGTLAGGALLGGVGAVVGGLSGSSQQKKKVRTIKIKLILRDTQTPSFEFTIYNMGKMKSDELKIYYQDAEKIKDTISVILDRVDREAAAEGQKATEKQKSTSLNVSVADELTKLAGLLEKGLLTEEEFKQQKAKILG